MNSYEENKVVAQDRLLELLKYSLGDDIKKFLEDDDVIEVMLNPDRTLWVDTLSKGMFYTGIKIAPEDSYRTIQTIATHIDKIVDYQNSIISAELPESGFRFEGIIPTNVKSPTFTIRKKALLIFTLDNYIKMEAINEKQKDVIIKAIKDKENILIVGGTSTGKTTFANAVIAEIAKEEERLVIIEDSEEIQSKSENTVFLKVSEFKTMRDLLKSTMRLRPDRIIVGEVRDGAALDLITAWNSGHPGGISTIHSDTPYGGLKQLEQYIQRVSISKQEELIAMTINLIITLKRVKKNGKIIRKVVDISKLKGFENGKYILEKIE